MDHVVDVKAVLPCFYGDRFDGFQIRDFELAAHPVFGDADNEAPGKAADLGEHEFLQARDIVKRLASVFTFGVDGLRLGVSRAVAADGIVGLQGETSGINLAVAFHAGGVVAMLFEQVTHGRRAIESGHERRGFLGWWGWRRAGEILQHPHAPLDGGRVHGKKTSRLPRTAGDA